MSQLLTILAGGNHSKDIKAVAHGCGIYGIRIYDDDPATGFDPPPADLSGPIIIGINDPALRAKMDDRFSHLQGFKPLVHPSVIVGERSQLGSGVVIAPGAVLLHSVTIGNHSHLNYMTSMTRCSIGDFCTIAPNATICGNVTIGDRCLIGASATVCERSVIGHDVTIGAGALIPPYSIVPNGVTVIGVWKQ